MSKYQLSQEEQWAASSSSPGENNASMDSSFGVLTGIYFTDEEKADLLEGWRQGFTWIETVDGQEGWGRFVDSRLGA